MCFNINRRIGFGFRFGVRQNHVRVAFCDRPNRRNNAMLKRRTRLTSMACVLLSLGVCFGAPFAAADRQFAERLYDTAK